MTGNLIKTPLLAVVYVALLQFSLLFMPFSGTYLGAQTAFTMPISGYLFALYYAVWVAIAVALLFSASTAKSTPLLIISLLSFAGIQWLLPLSTQLVTVDKAIPLEQTDTMNIIIAFSVCTLVLLLLSLLIFRRDSKPIDTSQPQKIGSKPAQNAKDIYKIKTLSLVIKILVIPIVYSILYFVTWYFLAWRVPAVQIFYGGQAKDNGFVAEVIVLLLGDSKLFIVALIKGLLYSLLSLPLLLLLKGKQMIFIFVNAMLYLSGAVMLLIPNAFMPQEIRIVHAVENGVLMLVFSVFVSFLLYSSLQKKDDTAAKPATAPAPAKAKAAKPAPAPAAAKK